MEASLQKSGKVRMHGFDRFSSVRSRERITRVVHERGFKRYKREVRINGAHCTVVVVRLVPPLGTPRLQGVLASEAHTRSPATRGRLRIKILAADPHALQELHTGASPQPDDVEAARDSFFKYYKGRVAEASRWPQVMPSCRPWSRKRPEARPQHGLTMASGRPQVMLSCRP